MGSGHELTIHTAGHLHPELIARITEPMDGTDGQAFVHVVGERGLVSEGLGGQAHLPDVFVLSLRHGSVSQTVESLRKLPWGYDEAVLVATGDYISGPATIEQVGYIKRELETWER